MRLFCFPFAGGNALTYRTWGDLLPRWLDVCPVELPGRGSRLREAPFTDIATLVPSLGRALVSLLDKPYALFGHSLGTLIGFELIRYFRKNSLPQPVHFFVSGHTSPSWPGTHPPIHNLPEFQFILELRKLNGTPEAVLANDELMQLLLPVLRADFAMNETYTYRESLPIDCPITAFGGTEDKDVTRESLEAWAKETRGNYSLTMLAGDHFFIQSSQQVILASVENELSRHAQHTVARRVG
ncbi:MAG: thioesterase II family protein [Candidatus Zhuqueibacterota bacterium]